MLSGIVNLTSRLSLKRYGSLWNNSDPNSCLILEKRQRTVPFVV